MTAMLWAKHDDDGKHVWVTHLCGNEQRETMLPWPTWKADDQDEAVTPSLDCELCGTHAFACIDADAYDLTVQMFGPADNESKVTE